MDKKTDAFASVSSPLEALCVFEHRLRGGDDHPGIVGHRAGEEGVAAHHGVLADDRLAAQDGRAGVDGHIVAHGGMALARQAGVARPGGQCPQRHALVQLDMAADDGGLADDDARAVVDEEPRPDLCAGVDVDAGAAVGVLRHHAGDHGDAAQIQLVGDAVDEDGEQAGVGEDDLLLVGGGRVAVKGGLNVGHQHLLDAGQLLQYLTGQSSGGKGLILRQRQGDLGGEGRLDALQQQRGVVLRRQSHQLRVAEIGGEEQPPQLLDDADDRAPVRQAQSLAVQRHGGMGHVVRHGAGDVSVGSHDNLLR